MCQYNYCYYTEAEEANWIGHSAALTSCLACTLTHAYINTCKGGACTSDVGSQTVKIWGVDCLAVCWKAMIA